MGIIENKAAAVAVHTQALPGGHVQALASRLAPGFVDHDGAPGPLGPLGPPLGPLGALDTRSGAAHLVARMHLFGDAFEDQCVRVLHVVAEGDLVTLHLETTARHTGYFRGIAPTGRRVVVQEMHVLRFAEGREAEHWCVRDEAALLRAIGQEPASVLGAAGPAGAPV